uniref:Uncharacterized protein n=1 Tax=Arundo donax TaxID=35708 RepID=A0A0A8Z8H7_ARUDO
MSDFFCSFNICNAMKIAFSISSLLVFSNNVSNADLLLLDKIIALLVSVTIGEVRCSSVFVSSKLTEVETFFILFGLLPNSFPSWLPFSLYLELLLSISFILVFAIEIRLIFTCITCRPFIARILNHISPLKNSLHCKEYIMRKRFHS